MQTIIQIDPDKLAKAAQSMLRAGRPAAARPLLAALARLKPDTQELPLLESGLRETEGKIPDAISVLDAALAARPADAALLKRRAGLRHRSGDSAAAIDDAAAAVIAAPRDASAKALLGVLLMERGDFAEARACLAEAGAMEPRNIDYRLGFAELAERSGEAQLAAALLAEGMALSPGRPEICCAAIRLALRRDLPAEAQRLAEAALRDGQANATILSLLGQAAHAQGRAADRARWLAEALKLAPADEALRHMAAAAGVVPPAERAPAEFVKAESEAQARRLVDTMFAEANRVPGLFRAAVLAHGGERGGLVLDLGSGSGLTAVALSDLGLGSFVGVDFSARMLAVARRWGLYAELAESDLIDFLISEQRAFSLILAADVLVWFGSLKGVFAAVRPRLANGGRFVLSLETANAEASPGESKARAKGREWVPEWILGPEGRYAHSEAAFEIAAREAGFRIVHRGAETLRQERGRAVEGLIVVLEPER